MNKTVGEHIRDLENRRRQLHQDSMKPGIGQTRRNQIEAEIRAVTTSISHFLAAIETERQLTIE